MAENSLFPREGQAGHLLDLLGGRPGPFKGEFTQGFTGEGSPETLPIGKLPTNVQAQILGNAPTEQGRQQQLGLLQQEAAINQMSPAELARQQVADQIQRAKRDKDVFDAQNQAGKFAKSQNLQDMQINEARAKAADRAKFGGLTAGEHNKNTRILNGLGTGMDNLNDLMTLSNTIGREALPGAGRGIYDALRLQMINTLRVQFEAGALQKGELELFESALPEFGAFTTRTQQEREAQMRELGRQVGIEYESYQGITQGAQDYVPRDTHQIIGPDGQPVTVPGRSIATMFGDPEFPAGSESVDSTAGERLGEVGGAVLESLSFGLPVEGILNFLSQPSPGLVEPKPRQ